MRKLLSLISVTALALAVAGPTSAQPYGPGMMGGGGGYGPGYGMMGGSGMMGGYGCCGYGPGYGMMGGGYGMMGGYGPGMMDGYGHQGMMGGGYGPGYGMMGGYSPGPMMGGSGYYGGKANLNLTTENAKNYLERMIAIGGNTHLKVGDVKEKDADMIVADIVTKDKDALVQRFVVDRHTGFYRPEENQ